MKRRPYDLISPRKNQSAIQRRGWIDEFKIKSHISVCWTNSCLGSGATGARSWYSREWSPFVDGGNRSRKVRAIWTVSLKSFNWKRIKRAEAESREDVRRSYRVTSNRRLSRTDVEWNSLEANATSLLRRWCITIIRETVASGRNVIS